MTHKHFMKFDRFLLYHPCQTVFICIIWIDALKDDFEKPKPKPKHKSNERKKSQQRYLQICCAIVLLCICLSLVSMRYDISHEKQKQTNSHSVLVDASDLYIYFNATAVTTACQTIRYYYCYFCNCQIAPLLHLLKIELQNATLIKKTVTY